MKILIVLFGATLLSFAFKFSFQENDVLGYWSISKEYNQLNRASSFDFNQPGLRFLKSGVLEKRQNSGWCGTEPISYANYKGTWEFKSDSSLHLRYPFWGGEIIEIWKIKSIGKEIIDFESIAFETIKSGERE